MVEVKLTHEFCVECRECGTVLSAAWSVRYGLPDQDTLLVEPCPTCINAAVDDAKEHDE